MINNRALSKQIRQQNQKMHACVWKCIIHTAYLQTGGIVYIISRSYS